MPDSTRLSFSPRQAEVLHASSDGAPLATVAERLGTTRTKIASRRSEVYHRLDVTHLPRGARRAAAVRAARQPLVPTQPPTTCLTNGSGQ